MGCNWNGHWLAAIWDDSMFSIMLDHLVGAQGTLIVSNWSKYSMSQTLLCTLVSTILGQIWKRRDSGWGQGVMVSPNTWMFRKLRGGGHPAFQWWVPKWRMQRDRRQMMRVAEITDKWGRTGPITGQECSRTAKSQGEIYNAIARLFERKLAQGKAEKKAILSQRREEFSGEKNRLERKEEKKWLSIIHVIFPYQSLQMMNWCNKSQYSIFPIYMERRP